LKPGPDLVEHLKLDLKANDRIAIIQSLFNKEITDGLVKGAVDTLQELGFKEDKLPVYQVSGAVEIPLVAKVLASKKRHIGILTLGAVIKGDTPHFDYVCQMVSSSIAALNLEYELPIGFGVLTTDNLAQANLRSKQDQHNKGRECALAIARQLLIIKRIHENR